jgi:hypothetical protein
VFRDPEKRRAARLRRRPGFATAGRVAHTPKRFQYGLQTTTAVAGIDRSAAARRFSHAVNREA